MALATDDLYRISVVNSFGGSCVTSGYKGVIVELNAYIGYEAFYNFYVLFEFP